MIIAIDFDGTIVENKFPKIGNPIPDAAGIIRQLYKEEHYIIINTCRTGEQITDCINYLIHEKIPFHRVNANNPDNVTKYNSDTRKIYAHCYIDDRNVGGLVPWLDTYEYITKLEEEYKSSL